MKAIWVVFSFFVAATLALFPLPTFLIACRIQILWMMLAFWILYSDRYPVFWIWVWGMFADLLLGTYFGQHAAVFLLLGYGLLKIRLRFKLYSLAQQMVIIGLSCLLNVLLQHWLASFVSLQAQHFSALWGALFSMLVWPLFVWIMQAYKRYVCRSVYIR